MIQSTLHSPSRPSWGGGAKGLSLFTGEERTIPRQSVYDMPFTKVYEALVAKAERKGRTRAEVDECIRWLTGYVSVDILDGLT